MENQNSYFDVAVIGGGPAGMTAAGRAGELGANVVLIEKNRELGRKLLLTGKGRCNLTQAEFDIRKLIAEYGKNGEFLFSPFSVFGVKEVIKFFEDRGLKTKIERGQRVFPVSDKAQDVLDVLLNYMKKNGVTILNSSEVVGLKKNGKKITGILLKNGGVVADNYILSTGGKSYPFTGSTGDGFKWAKELGHRITGLRPALVPIRVEEQWVKEVQGLTLKNVKISVFQNSKRQDSRFGEALFTHFGMSGPIILDMSKKIGNLLEKGKVKLSIDLKPALEFTILDERTKRDFAKYHNKMFKNALDDLLPKKLIPIVIRFSGIKPEKLVNQIIKEERHNLIRLLKGLEVTVFGLLDFESAIVTSGGVSLKEIDSKTMKSKLIDNLFFAGEIIDLDGPSGGYNLQMCWSTGYIAGENAAKSAKEIQKK